MSEAKKVGAITAMVLLAIFTSTFMGPLGFIMALWFAYMIFRK